MRINFSVHQDKKDNGNMGKRKTEEEKKNSRSIVERLSAAVLRSFRGWHGEKMVYIREIPRVTGTLEKARSYFDPTQTGWDRTTTSRRLLFGAEIRLCNN